MGSSNIWPAPDLLLVDGNPLENLHLFDEPEENLALIMATHTDEVHFSIG